MVFNGLGLWGEGEGVDVGKPQGNPHIEKLIVAIFGALGPRVNFDCNWRVIKGMVDMSLVMFPVHSALPKHPLPHNLWVG